MSYILDKASALKLVKNLSAELFSLYKVVPKIGAEIEFYLLGSDLKSQEILKSIGKQGVIVENEKGKNQYECVLEYSGDLPQLSARLSDLRDSIKVAASQSSLQAIFDAKPFANDYGSALHLHLSLHDTEDNNIYAARSIEENIFMQQSVAGILELTAEGMYIICNVEDDYSRYCAKFMAPTTLSWGGNNRTTAVRIPDSKPIHRRIEYRIAPANCEPLRLILLILLGIYHGFKNALVPLPRIYGNAFDEQYLLEKLPSNLVQAKNLFYNRGNVAKYISEFS